MSERKCEWKDGEFYPCEGVEQVAPYKMTDIEKKRYGIANSLMGREIFFCPFCGASLKNPVDIKVGMFGKFWEENPASHTWGVLSDIVFDNGGHPYRTDVGNWFNHFEPGLPTGFRDDGSPKEVEE